MADPRRQSRLVEEHRDELGLTRELRMQPLDGDRAREPDRAQQATEVHRGHTASRDLAVQRVAPDHPERGRRGLAAGVARCRIVHRGSDPYFRGERMMVPSPPFAQ